jgi:hypothetical protein
LSPAKVITDLPAGGTLRETSITEWEYRQAKVRGLETLSFLLAVDRQAK